MKRTTRTVLMGVTVVLATLAGGGLVAANDSVKAGGLAATNVDAASVQTDCSFPVTDTDVTGTAVTLDERPERIVVLQPSDAQIVWSLNASERVVGMPQGPTTAYLNDTANVTDVKNADGTVDVETVTNLSADLVLAANITRSGTVEKLRSTGTPVYHFGQVSSMAETYRYINTTGRLIGNCAAATDTVDAMQTRLDRIQQAVADEENPRAIYLFYGFTAGKNTHVHSMIEMAGGENIADSESGYYEISTSVVVDRDPQWIVQPSGAPSPSGKAINRTTAMQQGQVLTVNDNFANQAGPRVVDVVETMARTFHPDAFDENGDPIVETSTATATASATATSTPNGTTATATGPTATTQGSGPGFTVATVAVALVAVALLLGHRRKGV